MSDSVRSGRSLPAAYERSCTRDGERSAPRTPADLVARELQTHPGLDTAVALFRSVVVHGLGPHASAAEHAIVLADIDGVWHACDAAIAERYGDEP